MEVKNMKRKYWGSIAGFNTEKIKAVIEKVALRAFADTASGGDGGEGDNDPTGGDGGLFSEETRKKISEALKGENNPMYGVHRYGKNNPNTRKVICLNDNIVFDTVTECAKKI